MIKWFSCKA